MFDRPTVPVVAPRPGTVIVSTDGFVLMKVPPPPELAGLVHDIALYTERSHAPIRQLETASLVVPVLIGFADPFDLALGRLPTGDDAHQSFASGLTTKPVHIRSNGGCSCLEITFTPPGARRFLGLPMSELTESLVRLDAFGDRGIDELRRRLGEERDWTRRHAIAEAFLLGRMRQAPAISAATQWAYGEIVRTGGQVAIDRLADRAGWSRKHLGQRFHAEIGLAPKAVARVARFVRAQSLARSGSQGWAGVAAECGYADQAHLIRDFQEFAGTTPAEWLKAA